MAYTPTNWTNFPSTATPVNASNLNKIENELVALDTGKVDVEAGKGLSTNDYDNTAKSIVDGVTSALEEKVDKVAGKGLSTEDYTTTEKTKLAGISAQANKVEITPVVTEGTTLATISIDGVDTAIKGSDIEVDDEMSPTSPNPVENKAIYSALNDLLPEETAEGNPISISDASGLSAKSCEVTFSHIQSGSGDPSPENVRPISGRNGLVLTRMGKNLVDIADATITSQYSSKFFTLKKGTYTLSLFIKNNTEITGTCYLRDRDNTNVVYFGITANMNLKQSASFTLNEDMDLRLIISGTSSGYNYDISQVQIELGSTATEYTQYIRPTPHTATFPSTVYGGKFDFVSGTGESNMGIADMGDLNWAYGNNVFNVTISDKADTYLMYCSVYKPTNKSRSELENGELGIYSTGNMKRIAIRDDNYTTTDDFKTAVNGQTLCYELATPTEITLTAEQIALLKNNNTLWTDGDSVKLVYSADIKSYIAEQLQS